MTQLKDDLEAQLTEPTSRRHYIAGLVFSSIGSSVLLILANKTVMSQYGFSFVLTLSAFHFAATALFTRLAAHWRYFEPKRLEVPYKVIVQMAAFGCASIVFMNFNLSYNSVGFYQMTKLMCIPYIVVFTRYTKGQQLTFETFLALAMILIGVGATTVTDLELNFVGSIFGVLAIVSTAQFQLWQGSKQTEYKLNPLQITDIVMPTQLLIVFLSALALEFNPHIRTQTVLDVDLSIELIASILITCLAAIAVNIVTYALIGKTSALTFQVVGHLKTVLTLAGGYYMFPTSAPQNWYSFIGIFLALVGMVLYSDIKSSAVGSSLLCRFSGQSKLLTKLY